MPKAYTSNACVGWNGSSSLHCRIIVLHGHHRHRRGRSDDSSAAKPVSLRRVFSSSSIRMLVYQAKWVLSDISAGITDALTAQILPWCMSGPSSCRKTKASAIWSISRKRSDWREHRWRGRSVTNEFDFVGCSDGRMARDEVADVAMSITRCDDGRQEAKGMRETQKWDQIIVFQAHPEKNMIFNGLSNICQGKRVQTNANVIP